MRLQRLRSFRALWLANSVSLVGTQISMLAFPLLAITRLHASALEVSLLSAVEFFPVLLFGLPAGAWIGRFPNRAVLITADVVRAAFMAAVPVSGLLGWLNLPVLFVVAFIIGLGTLVFDVAQLSYLPALVDEDQLASSNAQLEGTRSFAQVAGPGVGGFLIALFTAPIAIAANVLTYAGSAVMLMFVRGRPTEPVEKTTLHKDVSEGVRFVFTHPLLRPLLLAATTAELAFAVVLALQVIYATNTLHLGAAAVGVALAVGNVGGLLGAALSVPVIKRLGQGMSTVLSIGVFSAGALLLPLATGAVGFGVSIFTVYLGVVVFNVLQATLTQTLTPVNLLTRMNSTWRFVTWSTVPVGATLGGVFVGPIGMRGVLWAAAATCALSIVPPLLSPLRSFHHASVDPHAGNESKMEVAA